MVDARDKVNRFDAELGDAAVADEFPMSALSGEESVVVNAEISAGIVERLAHVDFGAELAAEGVTTVALDEAGHLVEYRPDGTTGVVAQL